MGRPISTDELVDLMWGADAPASAINLVQQYIGALRRLLEPELRTRGTGSYLLRRGSGYLCAAGPGALDLVHFRELVASARVQVEERRSEVALELLIEALALWRGPAGDGMEHGSASQAVFEKLNQEFFTAAVTAAELALATGRPEVVLAPLRLAARMAPFHEPVQASLITALGAAGQQAAALSLFRMVRTRLADELGIEPGHVLATAHRRVLEQDLAPAAAHVEVGEQSAEHNMPVPPAPAEHTAPVSELVGRTEELATLRQALDRTFAGDSGLVLIEGEAGVGKTRILEEITVEAARRGALVVWSHCLDSDATPSMWPWTQVVDTVLRRVAPDARDEWLAGGLSVLMAPSSDLNPASALPFRVFERVTTLLETVSTRRALVMVVDDLHWADADSLRLLAYLASRIPNNVLLLGAFRVSAPTHNIDLARTLASVTRVPGHRRIALGPLNLTEVSDLIRHETGQPPSAAVTRSIFARTDGNPLFVQELSRLLSGGGELTDAAAARPEVPSTIRDIVLDLLSRLGEDAKALVELAALIGRDVDLGLLARAADLDVHTCLRRLEEIETLGLLGPAPDDPFAQRFAHDLLRESVVAAIPPQRALQFHLRIADALQSEDSLDDVVIERLAHHLWAAGPLADPARTVSALTRAGRRAAAKTALETAERFIRTAVQVAQSASLVDLELAALSELITVVGMSSPHGTAAIEIQERAEYLARSTGRHEDAAILLYSRWMALAYSAQYSRSETLARRLLDEGAASASPVVRALGLQAWGLQQVSVGNIGEAYRYLTEAGRNLVIVPAQRETDVVWYAQQLSAVGMLAETTALYGDVPGARALLERLESMAGDDPFKVTVWAVHAVRIASVVGDHTWALAVTRKGIAADPDLSFGFFGMYQRLAQHWALAMAGRDPSGSAHEVERLITENLLEPPRSDIATWYGLLAEMYLAAGALEPAAAALGSADRALDTYGQRYCEGLILLMRARLLQAQEQPVAAVRAAAEAARELSIAREAYLFADRAQVFLDSLASQAEPASLAAVPRLHPERGRPRRHLMPGDESAAE